MKAYGAGFDVEEIVKMTGIDNQRVAVIVKDESINNAVARQNFQNKVPLIKDIVGLGLDVMKDTLKALQDSKVRTRMIRRPSDLAALMSVINGLNIMLRLDQNQSTENTSTVNRTFQQTKVMLQELKTLDPVFGETYPVEPTEKT